LAHREPARSTGGDRPSGTDMKRVAAARTTGCYRNPYQAPPKHTGGSRTHAHTSTGANGGSHWRLDRARDEEKARARNGDGDTGDVRGCVCVGGGACAARALLSPTFGSGNTEHHPCRFCLRGGWTATAHAQISLPGTGDPPDPPRTRERRHDQRTQPVVEGRTQLRRAQANSGLVTPRVSAGSWQLKTHAPQSK
jgi:hypothetical protein